MKAIKEDSKVYIRKDCLLIVRKNCNGKRDCKKPRA